MVLIDTTVWIDFFANRSVPQVAALERLIEEGEDLCICGVILTEVLQGIRSDASYTKTKGYLQELLYVPMDRQIFVRSAELYRRLRAKGVTIRKPVDCMIAAVAMENDLVLLHHDHDFDRIAASSRLTVLLPPKSGPG